MKLKRISLLIAEREQQMKNKELHVQQLESQIERAAELHAKQLDDNIKQIAKLEGIILVRSKSLNTNSELQEHFEGTVEAAKNCQNELGMNKDNEMNKLRTLVGEKEGYEIRLQKQLESAEFELKTNAEQMQKLQQKLKGQVRL